MQPDAFYEALVPLAQSELAALRDSEEPPLARLEIESVAPATDAERGPHVAVVFRDSSRPGCRFGWRWAWRDDPKEHELKFAAGVLATNLEEDVLNPDYGLPDDCVENGVTWF
jgi:hypothetical protein